MSEGVNKTGQILLIVGAVVLAFLVGVLVGRKGHAPDVVGPAAPGVQISTDDAPAPAGPPLVAPVQAPPPAPVPKVAPDVQVQEDAAAVGMTTREEPAAPPPAEPPAPAVEAPPAN